MRSLLVSVFVIAITTVEISDALVCDPMPRCEDFQCYGIEPECAGIFFSYKSQEIYFGHYRFIHRGTIVKKIVKLRQNSYTPSD